jgi:hypothetical protein
MEKKKISFMDEKIIKRKVVKAFQYLKDKGCLDMFEADSSLKKGIAIYRWVFNAPKNKKRTLFHMSKARFSHPSKRVAYFAPSTWRADFETSGFKSEENVVGLFEVVKEANKKPGANYTYLLRIKKDINPFCLNNDDKVALLNNKINLHIQLNELKDIVKQSIYGGRDYYKFSQLIAIAVCELGLDGILYKPKTSFCVTGPIKGVSK